MPAFAFLDDALSYWAERTPQADAVRYGGVPYTYANFNAQVHELAQKLAVSGLGRGHRIGIQADKSIAGLVAVYAVLRIGAAYVPLDPNAPNVRIEKIAVDCELHAVLTDKRNLASVETLCTAHRIGLFNLDGGDWSLSVAQDCPVAEDGPRDPSDVSYLLYTSGSTGVPKGIAHTHRSGLAYAAMAAELCGLRPTDRVSNHTATHFDMSIFDIFSTFYVGACLVIIPEIYTKMPASLSKLVADEKISVWYSVPFALIQLADRGVMEKHNFSALRVVMFAGEAMQPEQLRRFAIHVPQARYINAYGPTETNHCTSFEMTADQIERMVTMPIGAAEAGVTCYISDIDPETGEGELWVAGDQLMLGYWRDLRAGQPSLRTLAGTDKAYYATGDLVREDQGLLYLVGRLDRQVKIRGFRVELDEVEKIISSCDGAAEVAVVFCPKAQALRAFVSALSNAELNSAIVAAHCQEHLPRYAVPTDIAILPALARTSTGKIDRRALTELPHV